MKLISSLNELEELDRRFNEICANLQYQPGSIFRIASQYLKHWGIDITPENEEWIKDSSEQSYYLEWKRGSEDSLKAIENAAEAAHLVLGNNTLNEWVAGVAINILIEKTRRKGNIVVCDIGAGAGDTTIAILDALAAKFTDQGDARDIAQKCHFYLLEPSWERLQIARTAIERHPLNAGDRIQRTIVESYDKCHLPMTMDGNFDMVYANAVFHHMSFPDYLGRIHGKLAEDGVLVMGDWHTTIWKYPSFVVPLLKSLGIENERLDEFKSRFNIGEGDAEQREKQLDDHQIRANRKMIDFEMALGEEFRKIPEKSRLFFLEAHESLPDRVKKIKDSDFITDIDELKKKHTDFVQTQQTVNRIYAGGEFASVIAAAKISGYVPERKKTPDAGIKIRKAFGG